MSRHLPCPKCGLPIALNSDVRRRHEAACDGRPMLTRDRYNEKKRGIAFKGVAHKKT